MTVQPKRGRPSDYCAEIALTICDRLAGRESLRAICAEAGMPDKATVFRWLGRHKDALLAPRKYGSRHPATKPGKIIAGSRRRRVGADGRS